MAVPQRHHLPRRILSIHTPTERGGPRAALFADAPLDRSPLRGVESRNNRIDKFDAAGNFLGKWGSPGSGDGQFKVPFDVAVDSHGNI
jgi:hypothetical protein